MLELKNAIEMGRECMLCAYVRTHPAYLDRGKIWCCKKQRAVRYVHDCEDFNLAQQHHLLNPTEIGIEDLIDFFDGTK